jgi:hypothetical protein
LLSLDVGDGGVQAGDYRGAFAEDAVGKNTRGTIKK